MPKIYSKLECRGNFKFVGNILQDASKRDSHMFNDLNDSQVEIWKEAAVNVNKNIE